MVSFDTVWTRIQAHAGQQFQQVRGGVFSYEATSSAVRPDRTNQQIPRLHFERALARLPFPNTVVLQDLRGPSYIYAILVDPRIRMGDW